MSPGLLSVSGEQQKFKILSDCHTFTKALSVELLASEEGLIPTSEKQLRRLFKKYYSSASEDCSPELLFDLISLQNNLAVCSYVRGDYRYSESLLRHCLEESHGLAQDLPAMTQEVSHPLDHLQMRRTSLYLSYNLANVLSQLSQFEEAESLYLQCLTQLEGQDPQSDHEGYDDDHLTILSNLAYLYSHQEEYHRLAGPLWRECVVRRKYLLDLVRQHRSLPQPLVVHTQPNHGRNRGEDDALLKNELFTFAHSSPPPSPSPPPPPREGAAGLVSWTKEEYQLFKLHQTIRWLCALFNFCCYSIERGRYDEENIPELLELCLDTCEALWSEEEENWELKDRIRAMKRQMDTHLSCDNPSKLLRPLWATIYEKTEPQLGRVDLRRSFTSPECGWGSATVVMNPKRWLEDAWKPNTTSASNRPHHKALRKLPSLS
jgi:hypothetical protein